MSEENMKMEQEIEQFCQEHGITVAALKRAGAIALIREQQTKENQ